MGEHPPRCRCGHAWRVHSLHHTIFAPEGTPIEELRRVGGPCQHPSSCKCLKYREADTQ